MEILKVGDEAYYQDNKVTILEVSDDPAAFKVTYKVEMVTRASTQRFWLHGGSVTITAVFKV
jgi:ABC-type polysaccharide/polyol phosphate transport system ATPase subunit